MSGMQIISTVFNTNVIERKYIMEYGWMCKKFLANLKENLFFFGTKFNKIKYKPSAT